MAFETITIRVEEKNQLKRLLRKRQLRAKGHYGWSDLIRDEILSRNKAEIEANDEN